MYKQPTASKEYSCCERHHLASTDQNVAMLCCAVPSLQGVPRGVLQLVAVACIMLAAKQDEVRACAQQGLRTTRLQILGQYVSCSKQCAVMAVTPRQ